MRVRKVPGRVVPKHIPWNNHIRLCPPDPETKYSVKNVQITTLHVNSAAGRFRAKFEEIYPSINVI